MVCGVLVHGMCCVCVLGTVSWHCWVLLAMTMHLDPELHCRRLFLHREHGELFSKLAITSHIHFTPWPTFTPVVMAHACGDDRPSIIMHDSCTVELKPHAHQMQLAFIYDGNFWFKYCCTVVRKVICINLF